MRLSTYTNDVAELSADAAIRQLQIGARPGVLYLHGGWTQLLDGLERHVEVRPGVKVARIEPAGGAMEVHTADGMLLGRQVIVATGTPAAARSLLPADPGWGNLGPPVTAACLDLGVCRIPTPGYVLGVDEPLLGVTQSPPARQAPGGHAVVQCLRYGATETDADRLVLDGHIGRLGVRAEDVVASRFLARMTVAGAQPRATTGGLAGRPSVSASGQRGMWVAGDWVGNEGLLADASLASGQRAARRALAALERSPATVA